VRPLAGFVAPVRRSCTYWNEVVTESAMNHRPHQRGFTRTTIPIMFTIDLHRGEEAPEGRADARRVSIDISRFEDDAEGQFRY